MLRRRGVPLWADAVIAFVVLVTAVIGGTRYWKRAVAIGQPFYYQNYFEPAVMVACGKGFVVARPQVEAMVPFLWRRADSFSCDAIPPDAPLGTEDMYQASWRYLMYAVGLTWRLAGVSWSTLGPLFAVLFGATLVAAYAIFRLGMGPLLAVSGVVALAFSSLHLGYMPSLRDYAKAPFTLILVFLLGVLVSGQVTRRRLLVVSAAYGAVVGLGYGFRTDLLAQLPPFLLALFAFVNGGIARNIRLKAGAAVLCLAMFLLTASPIIAAVYGSFGCQWHTAVLGFSRNFSRPLGVQDAPYNVSRQYLDEFVYTTVTSYAARARPGTPHLRYCMPAYDAAAGRYMIDVARRFPADMVVRAYASILRIVELPLTWGGPGVQRYVDLEEQPPNPGRGHRLGLAIAATAIGLATAGSLRLGLFLIGFVLYFAGYPALQFDARNYFHFEIISWWALGFIVQCMVTDIRPLVKSRQWDVIRSGAGRAALVLAATAAGLVVLLWGSRAYQQVAVRSLFARYNAAPKDEIPLDHVLSAGHGGTLRAAPRTDPETADYLLVEMNTWRCGEHPAVAFRYGPPARKDFSRTFTPTPDRSRDPTRIFMPVYDGFDRIDFSDLRPGCLGGVYRLRDPGQFPLLLEVMLPPDWRQRPLYQRLGGAGSS